MPDPNISHGRGGAGNIVPDETPYADGGIIREGPVGDQGDGSYSGGRGGAGNISSPGLRPTPGKTPGDADVVPETATVVLGKDYDRFHVGRGGEGNIHRQGKESVEGLNGGGNGGGSGVDGLAHGGDGIDGGKVDGLAHGDGHGHKGEGVKEKAKEMVGLGKK